MRPSSPHARCDVSEESDWSSAWRLAEDKFGAPVSVLINNAGVHTSAGWRVCLKVMLWGQFLGNEIAMDKMSTKKVAEFCLSCCVVAAMNCYTYLPRESRSRNDKLLLLDFSHY